MTPSGTQRFLCTRCKRTCTRFTQTVVAHIRKRDEFWRFAATMHRAWPTRKEARSLGVSPSTIWRWRRSLMERMLQRRERQRRRWRGDAVSVAHFMGERRRFWGQISERAWLERRGLRRKWLGEYFSGRPGTMVHFVIGERMDIRTLDEMTIEVGEGARMRPRVPKNFARTLVPGRIFWLFRGDWLTPVAYRSADSDEYTYITDPPKRYAPPHIPPPLKEIPRTALPASIQQAAVRARDLYYLFCYWADRFRGISFDYLRGYMAWFLEDLTLNRLPRIPMYPWIDPEGVRWWKRGRVASRG